MRAKTEIEFSCGSTLLWTNLRTDPSIAPGANHRHRNAFDAGINLVRLGLNGGLSHRWEDLIFRKVRDVKGRGRRGRCVINDVEGHEADLAVVLGKC